MNKYSDLSDIQIVDYYKSHDDASCDCLGELYKRYTKIVYLLCLKYLKDVQLAEDAASQIFENLIFSLRKFDISNFKSWLLTVCRNHCLFMLRQINSLQNFNIFYENNSSEFMEFEADFTLYSENNRENRVELVLDALKQLSTDQQKCLKLFYFESCSYSEIADKIGIDIKKVKSLIQNGKRNLKNYILDIEKKYDEEEYEFQNTIKLSTLFWILFLGI
ncbi:MAG: sigma-70 family RNA polymerase sigma factor [Bacteroidales bacterium]|nr:sigma-70 family RNA polymerase sigma factor [Bacteroidales bacterium]